MATILSLRVQAISVRERLRPLSDASVATLADSMKAIGLLQPITVGYVYGMMPRLISGHHRLEAAKALGWETIDCIVLPDTPTEDDRRRIEIAENLHRADLTKRQRAEQIAEWIRLTEAKAAEAQSPQPGANESKRSDRRGHRKASGVRAASRALGISKGEAHRATTIAKLPAEAKAKASELGLDNNAQALLSAAKAADPVASLEQAAARKREPKAANGNVVAFHKPLTEEEAAAIDAETDEHKDADFHITASDRDRAAVFFNAIRGMFLMKAKPEAIVDYITPPRTPPMIAKEYAEKIDFVFNQLKGVTDLLAVYKPTDLVVRLEDHAKAMGSSHLPAILDGMSDDDAIRVITAIEAIDQIHSFAHVRLRGRKRVLSSPPPQQTADNANVIRPDFTENVVRDEEVEENAVMVGKDAIHAFGGALGAMYGLEINPPAFWKEKGRHGTHGKLLYRALLTIQPIVNDLITEYGNGRRARS